MATLSIAATPDSSVESMDPQEVAAASVKARIESVLAGAPARLQAELARLRKLGVIDDKGQLINTELPPDMQPGARTDFGG